MKRGRTVSPVFQVEYKVILETFLRWVRTSANFYEVPWLIIEPKVSIIPSAWTTVIQALFSQRKVPVPSSMTKKILFYSYFLKNHLSFFMSYIEKGRTYCPVSLLHSRKFEGSIFYSSVTFPVSSNFFPRSMMYCLRSSLTCGCFKA